MEKIILVGHGSPKKDANRMEIVGRMLHALMHQECGGQCVTVCYLQFVRPTLEETLDGAVKDGAKRLIIHPYFLSPGEHVSSDIPGIIEAARAVNPGVEFIYTEPLGISEKIVGVVKERIDAARGLPPSSIEEESFRKLTGEAEFANIPPELLPIVKRVIHTTADFSFKDSLVFHPEAVRAGLSAIRAGKNILTDVEMVKAGIKRDILRRYGGEVVCRISKVSPPAGRTRAETAIDEAMDGSVGIVVIGNAPTALIRCIELIRSGRAVPELVIGVPVGFVRAVESKALLSAQEFPFITNAGRKGGSPVAAAIVNALLKMAEE